MAVDEAMADGRAFVTEYAVASRCRNGSRLGPTLPATVAMRAGPKDDPGLS